jgi:hypothetical protein
MKLYEKYSGQELKIAEKIQRRRLQLLVNSCIYYNKDNNIISDSQWDTWAKELVVLQHDYPEISSTVIWADEFRDWDGSTGAFLPLQDAWVIQKANSLMGIRRKINVAEIKSSNKKEIRIKNNTHKLF